MLNNFIKDSFPHSSQCTSDSIHQDMYEKNIFSFRNSPFNDKVESRILAEAPQTCFIPFVTLQECAPTEPDGNWTHKRSFSNQLNLQQPNNNIAWTILHWFMSYFPTENMAGANINEISINDELTVIFMKPVISMLKCISM